LELGVGGGVRLALGYRWRRRPRRRKVHQTQSPRDSPGAVSRRSICGIRPRRNRP
jgi:hypothetical protein